MSAPLRGADFASADWQIDAACRGSDPEVFFPVVDEDAAHAKAICARCDVRIECLDFAMASRQRYGVWGGFSEKGRAALRARGGRSAAYR